MEFVVTYHWLSGAYVSSRHQGFLKAYNELCDSFGQPATATARMEKTNEKI